MSEDPLESRLRNLMQDPSESAEVDRDVRACYPRAPEL